MKLEPNALILTTIGRILGQLNTIGHRLDALELNVSDVLEYVTPPSDLDDDDEPETDDAIVDQLLDAADEIEDSSPSPSAAEVAQNLREIARILQG